MDEIIFKLTYKFTLIAIVALVLAFCVNRFKKKHGAVGQEKINTSLKGSGLVAVNEPEGFIFGLQGNKKVVLSNNKEGHITIFGGSGKGKTSALLIPSLRVWNSPFFAIDISGDISKNVPGLKEDRMIIAPDEPSESCIVDIFSAIDLSEDIDEKREKLEQLVNLIVEIPPNSNDTQLYFSSTARKIFLAAMVGFYDIGMDFIDICKTTFFENVPDLAKLIKETENELAIGYISAIVKENEKNVAGAKSTLNDAIKIFADNSKMEQLIRRPKVDENGCIEEGVFYPKLVEEKQVFLKIPDKKQEYYSCFVHLVTGQILEYISSREFNPKTDKRILLALDEFASIGHFDILGPFRKFRKNGANLCILTQSLADIDLVYSENERKVILDNSQYIVVLSANDNSTREYFSSLVGREDKQNESVSSSQNGRSVSVSTQRDFAVNPEQWRSYDKHLVVIHPSGYTKLKKNFYFKEKESKK